MVFPSCLATLATGKTLLLQVALQCTSQASAPNYPNLKTLPSSNALKPTQKILLWIEEIWSSSATIPLLLMSRYSGWEQKFTKDLFLVCTRNVWLDVLWWPMLDENPTRVRWKFIWGSVPLGTISVDGNFPKCVITQRSPNRFNSDVNRLMSMMRELPTEKELENYLNHPRLIFLEWRMQPSYPRKRDGCK